MMFWRSNNDQSKRMNNFYPKGLKIDFCTVPNVTAGKKTIDLGYCGATKWAFDVKKRDDKLSIALNCSPSQKCLSKCGNWSVKADVQVRLHNHTSIEKALIASGIKIRFDRKDKGHNWSYSFDKVNEKSGFVKNGSVTFQINVGITKIDELYSGNFIDFSEPRAYETDIILVVGDKKFHVSKQILSIHSPVFKTMFNGNFNESTMAQIPINNVDLNAFHIFLQYIYMASIEIHEENVSQLLLMGDQFGVKKLTRECENFLMRSDIDEKGAIELAIFHSLDRILCEKIKSKTKEELAVWHSKGHTLPPVASNLLKKKLGTDQENQQENEQPVEKPNQDSPPDGDSESSETISSGSSDSDSDSD